MQQFYTPYIDKNTKEFYFDEQESKHIAKVLRKTSGETVRLTNGKGVLFWGKLEVSHPKKCKVYITKIENVPSPRTYVHIAVAPTKNMDRFEWFLEKATELGVQRITPIICSRSERKLLKYDRCEKIIHAAVKQSLSAYAPILDSAIPFEKFTTEATISCIAYCEDKPKTSLKEVASQHTSCCVLIGPEGDFTTEEIHWATTQNIHLVHLGNARLRTETAALIALHTINLLHQT